MSTHISSIIAAVAGGLFGGFIFSFLKEWAWRKYTKPELQLQNIARKWLKTDEDGDKVQVFRILVENEGRSAATNCKPELRMEGQSGDSEYEVSQQLTWSEGGNPQRVTINPGEIAEIDLLRIVAEERDSMFDVPPAFYIEFPGNNKWAGDDSIIVREYEDGRVVDASTPGRIEKSDFNDIEWEEAKLVITSENCKKEVGDLKFELGSERGMVGMQVLLE